MPRVARIVLPGLPHHVTQRGNNRQDVFLTDEDRRAYLELVKSQGRKCGVTILAYCLMGNHVHLVAVPTGEESLARGIGRTHFIYAQRFNERHGRSGHLWQGRFYSCAVEPARLPFVIRYVERNPVRAGLTGTAERYLWSSAVAHIAGKDPAGVVDTSGWSGMSGGLDWSEYLELPESANETTELRSRTMTGRPLGCDTFLDRLERRLGLVLRAKPVGRPRSRNR